MATRSFRTASASFLLLGFVAAPMGCGDDATVATDEPAAPADDTPIPPADDEPTPPADDTPVPPADDDSDPPADEPWAGHIEGEVVGEAIESEEATLQLVRVAEGLEYPWGMAFLPDGILVTERPGRMNIITADGITEVTGIPNIEVHRQGGLFDVALHPNFEETRWVYFSYSAGNAPDNMGTELARARLENTTLVDVEVLYTVEPKTSSGQHFGSRLLFLDDGTLLMTLGDHGGSNRAQDTRDPAGSTLRLRDDGGIPDDNPWVGNDDYLPELYTIGNRNSQSMTIHPETRQVWQMEHGPQGGDELNRIQAGLNYGWPEASYGADYQTGDPIGVTPDQAPQFEAPVEWWTPAIAPSGLTFYTSAAIPEWRNNLFSGTLAGRRLVRLVLDGEQVTHQEDLLVEQIGRIRDVRRSPDGHLYIAPDEATNASIYRLEPAR